MASLPFAYNALIDDLNRDIQRTQPADPLQFCASWFFTRLEQERSAARAQAAVLSAAAASPQPSHGPAQLWQQHSQQQYHPLRTGPTPPPPGSMPAATPPRLSLRLSNDPGIGAGVAEGYRFGGPSIGHRGSTYVPDRPASPFSERPPPGPFGNPPATTNGRSPALPGSQSSRRSTMEMLSKRISAAMPSAPGAGEDDEADEAGDRVSSMPPVGASSYAAGRGPGGPVVGDSLGIPAGVNLGRRTSVSAESLTPSALNAPPPPKVVIPKTAEQRKRIESSIVDNLLFRNLDEGQHNDVLNAMKEVRVGRGTEVIVQGAVGDYFYVVEEGRFDCYIRDANVAAADPNSAYHRRLSPSRASGVEVVPPAGVRKVRSYGPGGSFGELALMYNAPRAATIVATSASATLWALDRVTFRSILMEHTSRKRAMYEKFLAGVPILASLTPSERSKVADALEEKTFGEGEVVIREGEPGHDFYLIESGRAQFSKRRPGGSEEVIGAGGPGDYFGELALINSAPRAATVCAAPGAGKLRVARLGEEAFTRLLGPVLEILARRAENYSGFASSSGPPAGAEVESGAGAGGQHQVNGVGAGAGARAEAATAAGEGQGHGSRTPSGGSGFVGRSSAMARPSSTFGSYRAQAVGAEV